jgi:hypothetical protein
MNQREPLTPGKAPGLGRAEAPTLLLREYDQNNKGSVGMHDDRGTKIPMRGKHKCRDRKERVDEKSGNVEVKRRGEDIKVRAKDRQIDQGNQSLERGNRQQHAPQPDARCG